MQIAVLGPLTVHDDDGRRIEVAGLRLRALLTRLAVDAGRAVGVPTLVDAVWDDDPPAEQTNALQTLVSRLRRLLGADLVRGIQGGYQLAVQARDVDAHRFEDLAVRASALLRSGDYAAAADLLDEADALWRGPALTDALAAGDALAPQAARLDDLRVGTRADRIEVGVELGQPQVAVEAERLAADHPLDERIAALLMRALAGAGRQADALRAYERLRIRLADELGVDPSRDLQHLHVRLLQQTPDAHTEPAALAARSRSKTNLKAQLTSFVGREDDVARIAATLDRHRLVTLVGPGGAGKTRLASEAAARLVDASTDGVWMVELAPVTSGSDVPQAVLDSIGLRESGVLERSAQGTVLSARDASSRLIDNLANRHAVVLLDNCEHLIEASAVLADSLLARCPGLRILATSREPLGIVGEMLLPVPPLGHPAATASAAQALEFPAVRLFADRAVAVRPEFRVDDDSVAGVIEIVHRLDGLPLAIELAAARLRSLPVADIAIRLTDRFRLLTGGSRTALPRHRTLRAVVEWSWDLLADDERRLAETLSVFPAGVTAASAAAVATAPVDDVADLISSLVDKSLLQPVGAGNRLRMLETIREYGLERLAERGELADVRARHAKYFAQVMAEAEPHLTRADQVPWFELLAAERGNIIGALRYLCDAGDVDAALTLGISVSGYGLMLGLWTEISGWLGDVIALSEPSDPGAMVLARTLVALSSAADGPTSEDVEGGRRELLVLADQVGELSSRTSRWVPLMRPIVAFFADQPELSERYFAEGLVEADEWTRAAMLMFHANLAENFGDVARQRRDIDEAFALFTDLGERWGLSNTLRGMAQLQTLDGELDAAAESYYRSMRFSAQLHSHEDEGFVYSRLAELEIRRGNLDRAREHVARASAAAGEGGSSMEEILSLTMLAAVEYADGHFDTARQLQKEVLDRTSAMPREHPVQGHVRAMVLAASVELALDDGDLARARGLACDAWPIALGTKDMPIVAAVGVAIVRTLAVLGEPARAAMLLGATIRLRGAEDHTSPEVVRATRLLREVLGADGFAAGVAEGRALDREAALTVLSQTVDQALRL